MQADGMMQGEKLEVKIDIRTYSEANLRQHWAARARRAKAQREAAFLLMREALLRQSRIRRDKPQAPNPENDGVNLKPIVITLTRIAPRRLDPDNLARSMKAVQDGIADALRMDDGDPRLQWRYAQAKGKPKEYAVLVEIERK